MGEFILFGKARCCPHPPSPRPRARAEAEAPPRCATLGPPLAPEPPTSQARALSGVAQGRGPTSPSWRATSLAAVLRALAQDKDGELHAACDGGGGGGGGAAKGGGGDGA